MIEENLPSIKIVAYWDMQIYQVKEKNTIVDNFRLSLNGL